jgi:2-amino-4-hydroxy-6-hydroxymethyldihydropteridine diphosphokinase
MIIKAYIGLGSNLGDRAANLLLALRGLINSGLPVSRVSRIYETEPVGTIPQPDFLNMVCELHGALPRPHELMAALLRLELELGRTREMLRGPRTIDLDLLFYDDEVCDSSNLHLPHPRLHQRRFVLEPLAELAPALVHPTQHRTVGELLSSLDDRESVKLWLPRC